MAKKKTKAQLARRKLELQYVKMMEEQLNSVTANNGHGAALVQDKTGKAELLKFTTKSEALEVLKKIRKGTLSLVM